jgi:DNA-binding YbaB/EbfC family protein
MQGKIKEAQENLEKISATGESGANMVVATVNGKKKLIKLEIDDDIVKKEDKELMSDLIVAAVNKALENVEEKASEEMKKTTSGMLPNIPGMDFSKMF